MTLGHSRLDQRRSNRAPLNEWWKEELPGEGSPGPGGGELSSRGLWLRGLRAHCVPWDKSVALPAQPGVRVAEGRTVREERGGEDGAKRGSHRS